MNWKLLLPREHGAWAMLLLPFAAGAIVARSWDPLLVPALIAVLLVFLMRQPLLILARQRFLWRDEHAETADARQALLYEGTLLLACGALLLNGVPANVLVPMGVLAAALTLLSVYMTLKNRQRSVLLQAISACGLASTALLSAYLGTRNMLDGRTWALWLLLSLHFLTGIFLVHAALDRRAGKPEGGAMLQRAFFFIATSLTLAVASIVVGRMELVVPFLAGAAIGGLESYLLTRPAARAETLQSVGLRMLCGSIVYAAVTVICLW